MHDKRPYTPIGVSFRVFKDFRRNLLNLMAVKIFKIIFHKFSWTLTNLNCFREQSFRELLVSVSFDRAHLLSTATKNNLVSGFIF